jgi:cytidyltransferase-like protein
MENKKKKPVLTGTDKKYAVIECDPSKTRILKIIGSEVAFEDRVINDRDQLKWVVGVLKLEGLKIVYTSGVYDLIHIGHLKYLNKARELGHIVIVGVDSDELTRQRKADIPPRPIIPFEERLETLAYARTAHIYTMRDVVEHEDQLIVDILPDIALFSRSTHDVPDFEEKIQKNVSPYCGKVVFLDAQAKRSTSGIIRSLYIGGAAGLGDAITKTVENYLYPEKKEEKT